uniref:hypothetical chloroplast RF33 n=1 Tax=Haslea karadagensis TaxID=1146996 RepID=UPI0021FF7D52|nr:hypothetical chloroplast RF33 [Haslea karadagensis]UXN44838.1 hypothetical chloroplast RF33 [Haslea karadagensis]UXN45100.1 hypothetical protein [Haslea karadagensis]
MNDFWVNISRYPRFFISSVAGLVLVILAPLKNLFKIKKFRGLIFISFAIFFVLLFVIIRSMVGL